MDRSKPSKWRRKVAKYAPLSTALYGGRLKWLKSNYFFFRFVWRVLKAVSFALGPVLIDDTSRLQ